MNRRVFLRGIGGVSLAAPFLPSVAREGGEGADARRRPKRLVIFFTHNGCLTDRWWPKVSTYTNGAATLTADMLKGQTLEPLTPYISKLLVPRGFRSMNAYGSGQSIDPHDQAMGSKLTCATIDSANKRYATATSLDHVIAKQINPRRQDAAGAVGRRGQHRDQGDPVVLRRRARRSRRPSTRPTIYNQLTGVFGTGTAPAARPAQAATTWSSAGRASSISCKADLQRYQALKMSKVDQDAGPELDGPAPARRRPAMRADPRQPHVVQQDGRRGGAVQRATSANVTAASPTGKITLGSVLGNTPDPVGDKNLATSFTMGGDMFLNLIALSMICDMNRVILMLYPGYVTFNWDGIMHTHEHHGLSHRTGDFTVGGACGVTGVLDMINQIDQWYAGKYAKLVGLLDSISEGDGTLLDNTATMWLPELSDGAAHNLNNLPIVIAGSAAAT